MANGWALEGAVQNQIEDSVKDALATARARMPAGSGRADCEGKVESQSRRHAAKLCPVPGHAWPASLAATSTGLFPCINRRGSKDSQLR